MRKLTDLFIRNMSVPVECMNAVMEHNSAVEWLIMEATMELSYVEAEAYEYEAIRGIFAQRKALLIERQYLLRWVRRTAAWVTAQQERHAEFERGRMDAVWRRAEAEYLGTNNGTGVMRKALRSTRGGVLADAFREAVSEKRKAS
jgi:hypothetical protein